MYYICNVSLMTSNSYFIKLRHNIHPFKYYDIMIPCRSRRYGFFIVNNLNS